MITATQPTDIAIQPSEANHHQILVTSYIDFPNPQAQLLQDSSGHLGVFHPDTGFSFVNPEGQHLKDWAEWLLAHKVGLMAGELNSHFQLLKEMGALPGGETLGCRFELQHFGLLDQSFEPLPDVQQATLADLDRLTDFYQQAEDMQRSRENIAERLNENVVVYRELEGQIVAAALTHRHTQHSALIGGVYTAPGYRGKNHGRDCVQTLCALLKAKEKTPCLFYEQNNQAAATLYHKLGFKPLGGWIIIELIYELSEA